MKRGKEVAELKKELNGKNPEETMRTLTDRFNSEQLVLATSLGAEDQAITHGIAAAGGKIRIFTLDTGRLPNETYELIERTEARYGIKIAVYFPNQQSIESMISEKGINLFYNSVADRKKCCSVRKLEPLKRALAGVSVWITGIRREQALTRNQIELVDDDEANGLIKINPLYDWSEKKLWDFIRNNHIPYNPLHDKGYPSIGCVPCTRAVKPGEDVRAGRWWWENPAQKECGLHRRG